MSIVHERACPTLYEIQNQVHKERDPPSDVIVVGALSCQRMNTNNGSLENQ